jgi:two-component system sensor histidine kinase PilS (NtrC family)
MSDSTSLGDKNTIDRTQVFAVYNVYLLVIGSVLFTLSLADTGSGLLSDDSALQMIGASIFIISSLIIALLGSPSKFTTESGIFGVMMIDVLATTLVADPTTSLTSGFTTLYLVTVAAARMLQIHDWTKCLPNGLKVKCPTER